MLILLTLTCLVVSILLAKSHALRRTQIAGLQVRLDRQADTILRLSHAAEAARLELTAANVRVERLEEQRQQAIAALDEIARVCSVVVQRDDDDRE
jgi:hypothetical protein